MAILDARNIFVLTCQSIHECGDILHANYYVNSLTVIYC